MKNTAFLLSFFAIAVSAVSCVDENYDLSKLNTEITIGGENLVVPVAQTDSITVRDLIEKNPDVAKNFEILADGTYKASYKGSEDMSEELPDFSEMAKFQGTDFSADVSYTLDGLSPESFSFPEIDNTSEFDLVSVSTIASDAFKFTMDDIVTEFDIRDSIPSFITEINLPEESAVKFKFNEKFMFNEISVGKPELMASVDTVYFADTKGIDISIKAVESTLPAGISIKLKSFSIKFPSNIKVAGTDDNGLITFEDESLPFNKTLAVQYVIPENGTSSIGFSAEVHLKGEMLMWGSNVQVADINSGLELSMQAGADLVVSDFAAVTKTGEHELTIDPVKFSLDLPDGVSDFGNMILTPSGTPAFTVSLDIPETDFNIRTGDDGLVVTFPELITIKNGSLPSNCSYNTQNRKLTITGDLPSNLKLGIDHLTVVPYKSGDNKYVADGEVTVGGKVKLVSSRIHKKDMDSLMNAKCSSMVKSDAIQISTIAFEKLSVKYEKDLKTSLVKAGTLPKELAAIQEIEFDDTWFKLAMEFDGLPSVGANKVYNVSLKAELPDWVTPSEFTMNGVIENNKFKADSVQIQKVELSGIDISKDVDLDATFNLEISVDDPAIDVTSLSENIGVSIKGGISEIVVKKMEANIDYSLADFRQTIDINEILGDAKDKMDITFSLDNPYLMLDLGSNIGIPVKLKAELLPFKNGSVVNQKKVSIDAKYDKPASVDEESHLRLFLAKKDEGRPGDYEFKQADVSSLLSCKPDSIVMSLSAKTVNDEVATLITDAKYKMSVDYEIGTPLKLGEDFNISYRDTLATEGVGEFLEMADVVLFGTVENKLPLKFEFGLVFLDENNEEVKLLNSTKMEIESCNSDGSAKVSPFEFAVNLKNKALANTIRKTVVDFRLSCGSAVGVGVKADSYIRAILKLRLPEGITVDFKNIMDEEKNSYEK